MRIKVLASGSRGNAYHISDGKTAILLDAGIPIRQIKIGIGFTLSEIAGAFISHRHNDHSKAVPDLLKGGIDVYAPEDVFKAKDLIGYRCKAVEPLKTLTVGSFRVLPFNCEHDVPNMGYLIKSEHTGEQLLYFTDTYFLKYKFPGCTHIMAECNYSIDAINQSIANDRIPIELKKRLVQSHMSIDTLIELLKANDLSNIKQIYLLHLSDNNSRADEFKERIQKTVGCEVYVC